MSLPSLRERVAEALYDEPPKSGSGNRRPWTSLDQSSKAPWLADADRVIPIMARAAARIAEQRDPINPKAFLVDRERIGSVIEGMTMGAPDDWECPVGLPECRANCGAYGCGN